MRSPTSQIPHSSNAPGYSQEPLWLPDPLTRYGTYEISRIVMVFDHQDYRTYLKWCLAGRVTRNPHYSLRAFAQHLGIHHSSLVQVFQCRKRLSINRAHQVAHRLSLQGREYEYFCLLVELDHAKHPEQKSRILERLNEISPESKIRDLSVEHFQMISDWYHIPILQLLEVGDFEFNPENIARVFGIKKIEAEVAIQRLERLELIEKDETGKYQKVKPPTVRRL